MAAISSAEQLAALRVIDANANRASEGLRVAEDYFRMVRDDQHLAGLAKQMRHDLSSALADIPTIHRMAARDTPGDVGTKLSTPQEVSRTNLSAVLAANLERVPQALRTIEEYAKLGWPTAATAVEQLRYRAYTLAKAALTNLASTSRLQGATIYVLVNGEASEAAFAERMQRLLSGGPDVIQLRDKRLSDRELLARGRMLRSLLDANEPARRPLFIFNDRPDLAVLARADGVHVGQEELAVREVRKIVGPSLLVGVSTHNLAQAQAAVLEGASYLGCGPTFPSGTKAFDHFPGLEFLRQVSAQISLPAFAIGGITPANVAQVAAAGFGRIAVSGALEGSANPGEVICQLRAKLPP